MIEKEDIRCNPEIKRFIRVGTPIAFQEISYHDRLGGAMRNDIRDCDQPDLFW